MTVARGPSEIRPIGAKRQKKLAASEREDSKLCGVIESLSKSIESRSKAEQRLGAAKLRLKVLLAMPDTPHKESQLSALYAELLEVDSPGGQAESPAIGSSSADGSLDDSEEIDLHNGHSYSAVGSLMGIGSIVN